MCFLRLSMKMRCLAMQALEKASQTQELADRLAGLLQRYHAVDHPELQDL